jgi:hypothetical protein
MSSDLRAPSQMNTNKLYVNLAAIQSSIFQEDGTTKATWVTDATAVGALSTAFTAVLRDMGKTVYVGSAAGGAEKSTLLRKVQLVLPGAAGGVAGAAGAAGEFMTGYISLGGMTYGGGDGTPAKVARLN